MTISEAIAYLCSPTFNDSTEPVFVLRGRDPLALYAIGEWITRAQARGVNTSKILGAANVQEQFMTWPDKKLPD